MFQPVISAAPASGWRRAGLALVSMSLMGAAVQAAAINAVTAVTPTGTRNGGAGQETVITSITTASQTFSTPDLVGVKGTGFIDLQPNPTTNFTNDRGSGLGTTNNRTALVGLQAGRALLGLDQHDEFIRIYFVDATDTPTPVNSNGWIFILEWAATRDKFVVDLLTNTVTANTFTTPVVAATVNVYENDYNSSTGLTIPAVSSGSQPVGGVGIRLADVGVSGITGIQIRGTDPDGGLSGLDLAVVAIVVPEPATSLLLLAGGVTLLRRRPRR